MNVRDRLNQWKRGNSPHLKISPETTTVPNAFLAALPAILPPGLVGQVPALFVARPPPGARAFTAMSASKAFTTDGRDKERAAQLQEAAAMAGAPGGSGGSLAPFAAVDIAPGTFKYVLITASVAEGSETKELVRSGKGKERCCRRVTAALAP